MGTGTAGQVRSNCGGRAIGRDVFSARAERSGVRPIRETHLARGGELEISWPR